MFRKLICFSVLLLSSTSVFAQEFESWSIYPSYSTINSVTVSDGIAYNATLGGIFIVVDDSIHKQINTLDGLYPSDPSDIIYDSENSRLLIGYTDGMIDVVEFDDLSIERVRDISRFERFNSKRINDLELFNDQIYIATDFGIVVYNASTLLVEESYFKFGEFNIGAIASKIDILEDTLFVATEEGVAAGNMNENLGDSQNWIIYTEESGFPEANISDIVAFENGIFALVNNTVYKKNSNTWAAYSEFEAESINQISTDQSEQSLVAAKDDEIIVIDSEENKQSIQLQLNSNITDFVSTDEAMYIATSNEGLAIRNNETGDINFALPSGPYLNFFNKILVDEDAVIGTSTQSFPSSDPLNPFRGYYIFKEGDWFNYNRNTDEALSNTQMMYSLAATDSAYYFGSWGSGIVKHEKNTNEITVYNRNNSDLLGLSSSPNFIVISALHQDQEDNMWATSLASDFPLYVQLNGTENWIPFSSRSNNDLYFDLFIDSFDQKWISLISDSDQGRGLLVLDTGDNEDPDDDRSIRLTTNPENGNLPGSKVKAIVEDKNNEIWVGTDRGIARFIFPELIIEGGENEQQAQWLINEDTTAASRFLLRDVNVSSMAVNAENQKWIGSVNQGLWLLNQEGSRIEKRFTEENSNLISDNILSISIDDNTGEVYVATDLGLVSFQDIPKAPEQEMSTLKVFPNPFKYSEHQQIIIEGLGESKEIKILGVDGMVVNEIEALGGRTSWDGYGYNGQKLGTGVYFIVAYDNDEKAIGKVVIGN